VIHIDIYKLIGCHKQQIQLFILTIFETSIIFQKTIEVIDKLNC
jgi:hypothetical protein